MSGDGVVIGGALTPDMMSWGHCHYHHHCDQTASPSAQVSLPLDFGETSLDARDGSNELKKAIPL